MCGPCTLTTPAPPFPTLQPHLPLESAREPFLYASRTSSNKHPVGWQTGLPRLSRVSWPPGCELSWKSTRKPYRQPRKKVQPLPAASRKPIHSLRCDPRLSFDNFSCAEPADHTATTHFFAHLIAQLDCTACCTACCTVLQHNSSLPGMSTSTKTQCTEAASEDIAVLM